MTDAGSTGTASTTTVVTATISQCVDFGPDPADLFGVQDLLLLRFEP